MTCLFKIDVGFLFKIYVLEEEKPSLMDRAKLLEFYVSSF